MMPMTYHGYHAAQSYPTSYPEATLVPPGLNDPVSALANGDVLSRSASNSSLGHDGRAAQSSVPRAGH